ncbi:hypothetical protein C1645_824835 [Glomus cerebriforme]|uniref:Uncharacterized protein n=1 Tax=Glomus cerebriforme TaxID=658196 RepID=A0A397T331_9GLOM|nr:hypothetical protein C1645_824835 [Glomus cerebriforme]
MTVKTIAGITNLSYFEWPIAGDYAGYIRAQTLPDVSLWSLFSSNDIAKLVKIPLHKPTPNVTSHSTPSTIWNFPISQVQGNQITTDNSKLIQDNSGTQGISNIENFPLMRNINKTDRMSARNMVIQLQDLAKESEIQLENVPEIKTVEGWIARYSSSLRKEYAAQRVAENNNIFANKQNETLNRGVQPYNNNNNTNFDNTTSSSDSHRNTVKTVVLKDCSAKRKNPLVKI